MPYAPIFLRYFFVFLPVEVLQGPEVIEVKRKHRMRFFCGGAATTKRKNGQPMITTSEPRRTPTIPTSYSRFLPPPPGLEMGLAVVTEIVVMVEVAVSVEGVGSALGGG